MATAPKKPKESNKFIITETKLKLMMLNEKDKIKRIDLKSKKEEFSVLKRITVEDEPTDWVVCIKCNDNQLVKYDTAIGAGSVYSHLKSKSHTNNCGTKLVPVDKLLTKPVLMKDRQQIYDKFALWCAKDNRPFNIVESESFKALIGTLIKTVSKYGMVKTDDIVPCKETIRSHTNSLYQIIKSNLISSMAGVNYVNCTTDHWKDGMSGASYMTICIHYADSTGLKLNNRIIGSFEVVDKCAKTTIDNFNDKMNALGISTKVRLIVTDSASSQISAFRGMRWLPCAAHMMNLLQKYSFNLQDKKDTPDPIPTITRLIDSSKIIVKRVKKGNFSFELNSKLKQEVSARWDTIYDMLESISRNYQVLVGEEVLRQYMNDIGVGLLQELLDILVVLKQIRCMLCFDSNVTINQVYIAYLQIQKVMQPDTKKDF